jgi:hypothetical protein
MKMYRIQFTDPGFGPFANPAKKFERCGEVMTTLFAEFGNAPHLQSLVEPTAIAHYQAAVIETTEPARQGVAG